MELSCSLEWDECVFYKDSFMLDSCIHPAQLLPRPRFLDLGYELAKRCGGFLPHSSSFLKLEGVAPEISQLYSPHFISLFRHKAANSCKDYMAQSHHQRKALGSSETIVISKNRLKKLSPELTDHWHFVSF